MGDPVTGPSTASLFRPSTSIESRFVRRGSVIKLVKRKGDCYTALTLEPGKKRTTWVDPFEPNADPVLDSFDG